MDETALVILVPEAEAQVVSHRLRHDPAAAVGVPAHVTVLYPFRSVVDDRVADGIGALAATVPAFDVTFTSLARFPGHLVYLVPVPAEPFRLLTAITIDSFPDCPPYGGAIGDPTPHLTVANGVDDTTAGAVEADVSPRLPITARVEHLTLIAEDDVGRWAVVRQWPLGPPAGAAPARS